MDSRTHVWIGSTAACAPDRCVCVPCSRAQVLGLRNRIHHKGTQQRIFAVDLKPYEHVRRAICAGEEEYSRCASVKSEFGSSLASSRAIMLDCDGRSRIFRGLGFTFGLLSSLASRPSAA